MKSFVITITENERSVEVAERCIRSADRQSNLKVEMFDAVTPSKGYEQIAKNKGINLDFFGWDKGSRTENVVSAFLSHHSLWELAVKYKEEITIFEHDALVVGEIPRYIPYKGVVSIGAPSYGKFVQPTQLGVIPLTSKRYFPGAHAYRVNPKGAEALIRQAKENGGPTDVFLHLDFFPWLQEYYPWPVIAKDNFTTIQNKTGCLAKHNWKNGNGYDIEVVK